METEDILDRISKLLAKAKSTTNEHEAAIFADKAAELLAKHNLDEAMLRARDAEREEGPIGRHSYNGRSPDRWRELIIMGCAKLYFCEVVVNSRMKGKGRHEFVGRESNAKVAMLMADYLIATTKRLAREHSPHKADQTDFRRGCGLGLYNRLMALHAEKVRPTQAPVSNAGNLPALYNSESRAVREWMEAEMKLGTARRGRGMKIGASGAAGRSAADRISLNTQVTERRASRMLR